MVIGSIIDVLVTLTHNWYELSEKFHQKLNFCGKTHFQWYRGWILVKFQ